MGDARFRDARYPRLVGLEMRGVIAAVLALGCGREEPRKAPVSEPRHPAPPEDAAPRRNDRERLYLPAWEPPPDMIPIPAEPESGLRAFYIDKTEVTVSAYRECVEVGMCTEPGPDALNEHWRSCSQDAQCRESCMGFSDVTRCQVYPGETLCPAAQLNWDKPERSNHPVNCVTFWQAWRYCQFRGKRLPYLAEWTRAAANGPFPRPGQYPWGDAPKPSCDRVVMKGRKPGCGTGHTLPVGSKPKGATPAGVLDLSGNVAEIVTLGEYETDYMFERMGGDYAESLDRFFEAEHGAMGPGGATVGFRCAMIDPAHRDLAPPKRSGF